MLNDESYWRDFYEKNPRSPGNSPFVLWCLSNYGEIFKDKTVIDLCHGNARDTLTLAQNCKNVVAIDRACNRQNKKVDNVEFFRGTLDEYYGNPANKKADIIYCRFGFHAMTQDEQDRVFSFLPQYVFAEMRSDLSESPDYTHKRRLINSFQFIDNVIHDGYRVLYLQEGSGLSPTSNEDPVLIRGVFSRFLA